MSRVAPARTAAFEILLAVERGAEHSDELLHTDAVEKLSPQDRNLTMNIVMGTLRWQIALDERIAAFLTKPKAQLDPQVRMALRMGAFQLLHLDRVPAYAVIDDSVELAKRSGNRFAVGMVNAVLRKVAAISKKETDTVTNARELARATAHPLWMVERWVKSFGFDNARAVCGYDQETPATFIRAMDAEALRGEDIELVPGSFLTNAWRVVGGDVTAARAFREGRVRIQDEGSQLVAELAGNGQRILDACAAPGGKTVVLAARNPSAAITACDISRKRIEGMQRLLGRTGHAGAIEFVTDDVAKRRWASEFDLVLCDAPCSGTGTIGRNPEIRHRLTEDEIRRQRGKQVEILSSVMRAVAPGGRLLYSTCSLEPEENDEVVRRCLRENENFEFVRIDAEIDRLESAGILHADGARLLRASAVQDGCLRTIPGVHGCDGFFGAMMVRVG